MSGYNFLSPPWEPHEDEILRDFIENKSGSYVKLQELLPCRSLRALYDRGKTLGIKSKYDHRKYKYNESYFSEYTLENCYYAGYLMADGHISKTRKSKHGNDFVWSTATNDRHVLERFAKVTSYTGPIKNRAVRCTINDSGKLYEQSSLSISGCRWSKDLETKFGITEIKTNRAIVQNFPSGDHAKAFLIGLIDGDGTITRGKTDNTEFVIGFCSSSLPTVEWVKQFTDKMNIPTLSWRDNNIFKPKDENCHYYQIRGAQAAILYQKLAHIPVPKLDRKWKNPDILQCVNFLLRKYENSERKSISLADLGVQYVAI